MPKPSAPNDGNDARTPTPDRIPIVEEELKLEKREITTGRVTVRTVLDEEAVQVRGDTTRETAEVVRVPKSLVVDVAPEVRVDVDTTIIPVVEERLVLVKQLVLTEEVHVRLVKTTEPVTLAASRRVMRPIIERSSADDIVQPERTTDD